jgi:hypothetical protein
MKKFKIEISGKGCEAFLFKLDGEQLTSLSDGQVELDQMEEFEIEDILEVGSITQTNHVVVGLYTDSFNICVFDNQDNLIFESNSDFEFSDYIEDSIYNDDNYLMVRDSQKGTFFIYELELSGDFNPSLLSVETKELLDGALELITDIKYDGVEMEKDFGDTTSKGIYYKLN